MFIEKLSYLEILFFIYDFESDLQSTISWEDLSSAYPDLIKWVQEPRFLRTEFLPVPPRLPCRKCTPVKLISTGRFNRIDCCNEPSNTDSPLIIRLLDKSLEI